MARSERPGLIADVADRTGYRFQDEQLLVRALTHRSLPSARENYEALEFLGDRILAMVIAEHLYRASPGASVGELAQAFNKMVCAETLAEVAGALVIGDLVFTDVRNVAGKTSGRMLADVCEALIAAIYLDGGLEAARSFIVKHWQDRIGDAWLGGKDAKTTLQEWLAARSLGSPVYSEIGRAGPDHLPSFLVEVAVAGLDPAQGRGGSKRQAEQRAAEAMLRRGGVWPGGA
ncbi:MAG: ribonuclease III [Pseudomonadota bacterium]|nr:ribonuclease III [Pseudomonadota bacterium]